jgi:hypothetical protein
VSMNEHQAMERLLEISGMAAFISGGLIGSLLTNGRNRTLVILAAFGAALLVPRHWVYAPVRAVGFACCVCLLVYVGMDARRAPK